MSTVPQKELSSEDSDAKKFNYNMIQLLDQLSKVYPDDRDLWTYRDKLMLVSKANAKIPADNFIYFCQPHIKQIMTRDDSFFVNFKYEEKVTWDKKYLDLIHKVISMWNDTDNLALKEVIWKYLQILLTYSIKAMKKYELVDELNLYRKVPLKI